MRARASSRRGVARVLPHGLGVRDAVRDRAGSARPRDVAGTVLEARALGRALEATVLVEEPCVEVEDLLADEVEAEVPRLDHACVDRPDRHLVRISALHRHRPASDVEIVVDERSQRLVAVEAHAVQVVRLALVPVRGGDQVDDRRHGAGHRLDGLEPDLATLARRARPAPARRPRLRTAPQTTTRSRARRRSAPRYALTRRPASPRRAPSPAATERAR